MIVQCKEEDVEKNGYRHTGSQTDRNVKYRPRPVQGLGWVKIYTELQKHQVSASVVNKTNLPMSLLLI